MTKNDKMCLFYNGPFSQWYIAPMEINGVTYNCCEQWMMYNKAMLFNDLATATKIMCASHPEHQKRLGRNVKDFDKTKWNEIAQDVVYRGNLAKFTQHQDCKDILMGTGELVIVEASPTDRIWGIGLAEDNPDAFDQSKWNGTNWLGEAIMRVRAELRCVPGFIMS